MTGTPSEILVLPARRGGKTDRNIRDARLTADQVEMLVRLLVKPEAR